MARSKAATKKPIRGYEGLYSVSIDGEVFTHPRLGSNTLKAGVLSPGVNSDGYKTVVLWKNRVGKSFKVHRLVANAFIENPYGYKIINHKNGDKTDNYIGNLEWCTPGTNVQHAYDTGLASHIGEKNTKSKLTDRNVEKIKCGFLMGIKNRDLANIFGVHISTIQKIKRGVAWSHIKLNIK